MAAMGILPRLSAKNQASVSVPAPDRAVKLRPEARAVSRADL